MWICDPSSQGTPLLMGLMTVGATPTRSFMFVYACVAQLEEAPDLGSGCLGVQIPPQVPIWHV
jgi:hypothetical protein